ncbi:unnamed protein product, partial [Mesorhabditis spiculigera]
MESGRSTKFETERLEWPIVEPNGDEETGNYICLRTGDDHDFWIPVPFAAQSSSVTSIVNGPTPGDDDKTAYEFRFICSNVMRWICNYMGYKFIYTGKESVPTFEVDPNIALPLLHAATFFDC